MRIKRRYSKLVKVAGVKIGSGNPVVIQSMAKVKTADVENVLAQIGRLDNAGCQIVRLAVKDFDDARALRQIKKSARIPLVADIHFDWRLAVMAIENGADKIRLNPGNINADQELRQVIAALRSAGIPLRIGLNSGSVKISAQNAKLSMADKLVASCLRYIRKIEGLKFSDIVISLKANNVPDTLEAYRKIAGRCDYPLHLGVTATGAVYNGIIKSSIALGALLLEGIGDTIRVSLTDDPLEEVRAAKCILESIGQRNPSGARIISCPTCGRCEIDLVRLVKELENRLAVADCRLRARPIKLAVMGCVVNGPGEAKEADIGVAFGKQEGLLFRKGKAIRKISYHNCIKQLLKEMER